MEIDQNIVQRAITSWGDEKQLRMVAEECLELALEITKFLDRAHQPDSVTKLRAEIADVNIMISQANIIMGEAFVQEQVDKKLKRLSGRLDRREF